MSNRKSLPSFVSSIKINGVHFLPPVITEDRRLELKRYQEQAVKLEKYLRDSKLLRSNLDELLGSPKVSQENEYGGVRRKQKSLSADIVDVSEYSNDGVKVIEKRYEKDEKEVKVLFSNRRDSLPAHVTSASSEDSSPRPRLIRSNSYTLETPSPLLLAHLEKESAQNSTNSLSMENSDLESIDTVITNIETASKKETASPNLELIQTDISVQHISLNAGNGEDKSSVISDEQLVQLLRKIPEEYSRRIIEILETQKQNKTKKPEKEVDDIFSSCTVSPSNSLHNTLSSSSTPLPSLGQLNKLDDRKTPLLANNYKRSCLFDKFDYTFYTRNSEDQQQRIAAKREWAANVIAAHVKGYLTRRLLKTERVQSIIETIKDALLCALQMHNSNIIDQSDVELHRRLLNQVHAACYAFHDIFFALSVPEKMSIISADRQRKLEKAKRPISAPNIRRSSSGAEKFRTLMSKSLTKI